MGILTVEHLSKKFGKKVVLDDVSFTLQEGEITGLVGPNGAGKSTLIKLILGLYPIHQGNVIVGGFSLKKEFEQALALIGTIVESPDMYEKLSGRKNLEIYATLNGVKDYRYFQDIVNKVRLKERINDKVKKYSLGMKQRLGIAQALITKPKLLILDEPTNGLDPSGMVELRALLLELKQEGIAILVSSHILSEIEHICDHIIMIDQGKLMGQFDMKELKEKQLSLEDEYLDRIKFREGQIR